MPILGVFAQSTLIKPGCIQLQLPCYACKIFINHFELHDYWILLSKFRGIGKITKKPMFADILNYVAYPIGLTLNTLLIQNDN